MKPVKYLDNLPNVENAEPQHDEDQREQYEEIDESLHVSPTGFEELDAFQHEQGKGHQRDDDCETGEGGIITTDVSESIEKDERENNDFPDHGCVVLST